MYFGCCDSSCKSNYALHSREGIMKLFNKKQRLDIRNNQALVLGILQIRLQAVSGDDQIFFTEVSMTREDEQCSNYTCRVITIDAFFGDLVTAIKPDQRPVISAHLVMHRDDDKVDWLPVSLHCIVRNFSSIPQPITESLTLGEANRSIQALLTLFSKKTVV